MIAKRIAAGIGGLCIFAVIGFLSVGTALLAPAGMAVSHLITRWLKQPTTLLTSWLGGFLPVALAMLIGGGVFAAKVPKTDPVKLQHMMDSLATERKAHPGMLDRLAPRGADTARIDLSKNPGVVKYFGIFSIFLGLMIVGLICGTVAWGSSLLLWYAIKGRWPARAGPAVGEYL